VNKDKAFVLGLWAGLSLCAAPMFLFVIPWAHQQGVRDALAGKYVVVQLPDGTSVVVENKQEAGK
jgi:hypothetical protein